MKLKFLPLILAPLAGLLYLLTAAPFMLWLDAPRFVAAIATLGVPNPPEPLYVMLAKPFAYLPFGSIIFRIQVFSALTASVALLILYKTIGLQVEVLVGKVATKSAKTVLGLTALFGTAMLAFSYQFWSQAQNVETFILVVLIEVVCLYLILTAQTKRAFLINLSIISLLMGLASGTNPVIACIIPSLIWVMWQKRKFWSIPGFVIWVVVGIVAIIAVHLYIPIRAGAGPFLNYWRATDLESVWHVSTGSGLNVYVPELGRVNGFTGSPEIFFKSTWHFIETLFWKFTPMLLPFIFLGSVFLWKKSKTYFIFWFLIIITNWFFAGLYFSGNQESWFLVSDIAWVVMGALGFYSLVTGYLEEILKKFKVLKFTKKFKNLNWLVVAAFIPLIFWFPTLNRSGWTLTEDYIQNLYHPIGDQKAIIFGSSDLYDSVSFYVHDIPGTPVYRPNVVPITDNLFYIYQWYRDNLSSTSDLKMPDGSKLKYNSMDEYSNFVADFFNLNMDKFKIYITIPAIRNNFLQAYEPQDYGLGGSLKLEEKFKLVPQGMLFEVLPKEATGSPDLKNFDYKFKKGFPKNQPRMLEQTYKTEMIGVINEYAYSLEYMGDESLKAGKAEDAFNFYQKAFEFNPKNAEIISRLGNYYGNIGDHQKATEFFEKALKIEPKNIGLLFNLAIAYENTGKIDKAISNLNKVVQIAQPNSQIGQLAKTRLESLKSSTPSGQQASASGSLQNQLLPQQLASGVTPYQNESLNLSFLVPKGFKVTQEQSGVVKVSNNLLAKDELTFFLTGKRIGEGDVEKMGENLPFKVDGAELVSQPVTIPGFQAVGKTYGTGEHLTFLLLLKRNDFGWALKIYPGDSKKSEDFSMILGSLKALK